MHRHRRQLHAPASRSASCSTTRATTRRTASTSTTSSSSAPTSSTDCRSNRAASSASRRAPALPATSTSRRTGSGATGCSASAPASRSLSVGDRAGCRRYGFVVGVAAVDLPVRARRAVKKPGAPTSASIRATMQTRRAPHRPCSCRPDGNLLTPTTRFSFETLPNVFLEKLAGGNVTYFGDRRNSVGLTALRRAGAEPGQRRRSRLPGVVAHIRSASRFGAIGANFAFGREWFDIFGEAALSFDNMPPPDPTLTAARAAAVRPRSSA